MRGIAAGLWALLGGDPSALNHLELAGERRALPSVFDVSGVATATVGVATLAAAELLATRNHHDIEPVVIDTREASAAFRSEALFAPEGWELPPIWDPIAGNYCGADGWILLHTNYSRHRTAALRALGLDHADRDEVAVAVTEWSVDALEARIVAEGGVAAAMRTRSEWLEHPQGAATAATPPVELLSDCGDSEGLLPPSSSPLSGVKVLDLTRVIAGPLATRFLSSWGADVLRVDPPGFEEMPALLPETTAGKRCAVLDLSTPSGRGDLLALVAECDVVVHGYRPGALDALGLGHDQFREANPGVIVSQHDAYGWTGPWAGRRGFDSLVQMSCGIAAAPGAEQPQPLPAQALDHATAMLIAAAVCRALTIRQRSRVVSEVRSSLIGAANLVAQHPDPEATVIPASTFTVHDTELRSTWWGPARAARLPGRIGDHRPRLVHEAGPLGRHAAEFAPTAD